MKQKESFSLFIRCSFGLVVFFLVLQTGLAWAEPFRRMGQNARGLALGDTGMSYSNDEMAFFYNPAGLGEMEDLFWIEAMPLNVEAQADLLSLVTREQGLTLDKPQEDIPKYLNKNLSARVFTYPHVLINIFDGYSFGVSYAYEASTEFSIESSGTDIEMRGFYRKDKGPVGVLSGSFFDEALLVGLGMRRIQRTEKEGNVGAAEVAQIMLENNSVDLKDLLSTQERRGSGTMFDFGLIWRLESFYLLQNQLAFTANNLGGTDFFGDGDEDPQEFSVGWNIRPFQNYFFTTMVAAEYRDITKERTPDSDTSKRTHLGVELGIWPTDQATNFLTFRGGMSGKKSSVGIEIALGHFFSFQYAEYFTEYGDNSGDNPRKQKSYQINFFGF